VLAGRGEKRGHGSTIGSVITGLASNHASATCGRGTARAFAVSATRSTTLRSASSVFAKSRPKASSVSVRILM
jgi:hypothetical protein